MTQHTDVCEQLVEKYRSHIDQATKNRFLQDLVASGASEFDRFSVWLQQDYHFVLFYLHITTILLERSTNEAPNPERFIENMLTTINQVTTEAQLFKEQAALLKIDLPLSKESYAQSTSNYMAFLSDVTKNGTWQEAILVYWAVEEAYSRAWTSVKTNPRFASDSPYQLFVKNWTTPQFAKFIKWLRLEVAESVSEITPALCDKFEHVFQLEQAFWSYPYTV